MMTPYLMRFGLFVLTAGLVSPGQAEVQPRYPTNHQSWSTEAGLPQNSVHQILQSHDGFLWLATEGGAVRCDGASFKVFNHDTDPSFTSSDVTSLAEDRRGNIWFGTADGIIEYTSRHTIHFGPSDGLPAATVASVAPTDDGSVLVLAAGGLAKFDGSRFQAVQPEPAYVDHLQPEPDGPVVLFSQTNLSLYTRMSTSPYQMPASLDGSELRGFLGRQNGAVWLWTDREVQFRFPKRQITWHIGSDLPGTRIQSFAVDRSGRAWIGTNRGLVTATPGQHPETVRELGQNSILSILEDAEGNLWIGTDTSGLHALRRRAFREQPALTDEEISCVAQSSDGSIWIGTRQDGLRRIRSESLTDKVDRPVANNALTSPVILSLAPGFSGDMWVGTPDGLTHISSKGIVTRYTSSDGLPDDLVRSLLVSRDGTVWIGTRHGLARFQSGR